MAKQRASRRLAAHQKPLLPHPMPIPLLTAVSFYSRLVVLVLSPHLSLFWPQFDSIVQIHSFWPFDLDSFVFCIGYITSSLGFSRGGSLLAVASHRCRMNTVKTDQHYIVQQLKIQWSRTKSWQDFRLREWKDEKKQSLSANRFSSKVSCKLFNCVYLGFYLVF